MKKTKYFLINQIIEFNYFLLASLILVVIGVVDDHRNISVSLRLFFQALVAIIVVSAGGINIASFGSLFGNGEILLHEWSYFVSVIAIPLSRAIDGALTILISGSVELRIPATAAAVIGEQL